MLEQMDHRSPHTHTLRDRTRTATDFCPLILSRIGKGRDIEPDARTNLKLLYLSVLWSGKGNLGRQVLPTIFIDPPLRLAALAIAMKPFNVSSSSKRSAWYSSGDKICSSGATLLDFLDLGFLTGDSTRPTCLFAQLLSTGTA